MKKKGEYLLRIRCLKFYLKFGRNDIRNNQAHLLEHRTCLKSIIFLANILGKFLEGSVLLTLLS